MRFGGRVFEAACWCIAMAGSGVAVSSWRNGLTVDGPRITKSGGALAWSPAILPESLTQAVTTLVQSDPFRLSRRPSPVPFGADPAPPALPTTTVQRPQIILAGIIGGPPWTAVLEGLPGRDGPVVVQRGDTLAGIHIREIRNDYVVVASADTVLRLTMKRTWQ